jgi:hypothetical protein
MKVYSVSLCKSIQAETEEEAIQEFIKEVEHYPVDIDQVSCEEDEALTEDLEWEEKVRLEKLLIDDDISSIRQMIMNDDYSYLSDILEDHYNQQSLEQVQKEVREREIPKEEERDGN